MVPGDIPEQDDTQDSVLAEQQGADKSNGADVHDYHLHVHG